MRIAVAAEIMVEVNKDVEASGKPACFDSKEDYVFWLGTEEAQTQPVKRFICEDCTVCFQRSMRTEGRCVNDLYNVKEVA